MNTLKIQSDEIRLFTTGKSHLGDGILYGLMLRNESDEQAQSLTKIVPKNTTLNDLIKDMKVIQRT